MNIQTFCIIFLIIMLPVNVCCAFWIFKEALCLSGMTFRELLERASHSAFPSGRHGLDRRQRFLIRFFKDNSSDPERSIRLMWTFGICTLPGLAALLLAMYAAGKPDKLKYVLIGCLLLVLINIALVLAGRIYRGKHPLDEKTAEILRAKREKEKEKNGKKRTKNIIVYTIVGAFFFAILLVFYLGVADISRIQSVKINHSDVNTVLSKKGFETANVPTTYWSYDENKLENVCAGIKDDMKFEFYEYKDGETTGLVYEQIVNDIAKDMEPDERAEHETSLPDSNKMFTIIIDGVYHLVTYKNDTVIYAHSPDSLDEINDIQFETGYLKNR